MAENPVQPKKAKNKVGGKFWWVWKVKESSGLKKKKMLLKYDKIKWILTFKFRAHRWFLSL